MNYDYIIEENTEKLIVSDKDLKILAKKNSKLDIINLNTTSKKEITAEEDSEVNFYEMILGNNSSESIIKLNGKNSKTNNYCLFFQNNNEEVNVNVSAMHNNENTHSNLICKGVLDGKSKLNYNGKIRIEKGAKNSNGYQKQDTLLLSEDADANSIPQLEILENDVKCSHGVTMSKINDDHLFYLKSRGLNEDESKKLIIQGFFFPFTEKIASENIKNQMKNAIMERIG